MSGPAKTSTSSVAKRMLVGRAFSSANLEHTLLPKVLALPVFASDALSSVAYATEEILIALPDRERRRRPTYVMPIAIAIAALMVDRRELLPADRPGLPRAAAAPTSSARRTSGMLAGARRRRGAARSTT